MEEGQIDRPGEWLTEGKKRERGNEKDSQEGLTDVQERRKKTEKRDS